LLAPFLGSSLETWTAVIGVFLAGISLGNWLGGQLADRAASARTLGWTLLAGCLTTLWALGLVRLLGTGEVLRPVPLGLRIPLLTLAACLPPSLVLSLITPVTIKIMLPDVRRTGRVVGLVYALGTLGSLVGNYLTGFVLLEAYTTHTIVLGIAGALAVLGALSFFGKAAAPAADAGPARGPATAPAPAAPLLSPRAAYATVFVASFCSMVLELNASRFLAPVLGVSLYSWTGIIGVVLAGIVLGNYVGGWVADRSPKRETLGTTLFLAGMFTIGVFIIYRILNFPAENRWIARLPAVGDSFTRAISHAQTSLEQLDLVPKIIAWTAVLFLVPMALLGAISPQVTRLAVADWGHAGRVAGRIYAWSCAGAIAGTFAAGYWLIAALGVNGVIMLVALGLILLSIPVGRAWLRPGELFLSAVVCGGALLAMVYPDFLKKDYDLETNYYAIKVSDDEYEGEPVRKLVLDHLIHSYVKGEAVMDGENVALDENKDEKFIPDNTFLGYAHEQVQSEFAWEAFARAGERPRLLVIGGGGYTLPRYLEAQMPAATVEVVEIDRGVTEIAHRKLGLSRRTRIDTHFMDGRQFVQERAAPGQFDLVMLDAVNDLSVPYHLITKEFNDAVKRALSPEGVYLLTVIDEFEEGELMRAAVRTMKQTFAHVHLLGASALWKPAAEGDEVGRQVWVIYGSDRPFDLDSLRQAVQRQGGGVKTVAMPDEDLAAYLAKDPQIILTDAYAPVDNLISIAFRKR
jgi:spermidine synthase